MSRFVDKDINQGRQIVKQSIVQEEIGGREEWEGEDFPKVVFTVPDEEQIKVTEAP